MAIWYVLSVVLLGAAVHAVASAVERTSPDPLWRATPVGCRRWWLARLLPIYVCLAPVGCTLSRGQVNLALLAFLGFAVAAVLRGRGSGPAYGWRRRWS